MYIIGKHSHSQAKVQSFETSCKGVVPTSKLAVEPVVCSAIISLFVTEEFVS